MTPAPLSDSGAEAYVIDLGEPRARDHLLTGGKAAALARAAQRGLPVPRGFVITRRFFDEVEQPSWKQGQDAVADDIDLALSRRGALVHDVGRVAVPVHIWQKGAPLTPDDWERARLHAYHSERVLTRSHSSRRWGRLPPPTISDSTARATTAE